MVLFVPSPWAFARFLWSWALYLQFQRRPLQWNRPKRPAGGEREAWFGLLFLTLQARRESDSVTVWSWGSLTSLGATFTGKEQQQHTHSGQTTLKRKKATGSGSQARKGLAAHSGCLLLIKETFARAHLLATGSRLGPAPAFRPVATGPAPGRAGCSLLFTSGQPWPLCTKTHCAQVHRLSFGSL